MIVNIACATGGEVDHSRIDGIIAELVGTPQIRAGSAVPGASVLVARGGEILFRRSYGSADVEAGIAAAPATNYRLASITKQFTAAGILRLADLGRLSIEDPVTVHLPELGATFDEATIRHLLTHTSGIVDYEEVIPQRWSRQLRDGDVLRLVAENPRFYFAPGTGYRYSNSAYALLALIVERVAERSFSEFLRAEVFSRAGMRNSVALVEGENAVPARAYGYSLSEGTWVRTDQSRTSAVLGDGGIYSSVDEMLRWSEAFHSGRVVTPGRVREATSPLVQTDREGVAYGFGWRISEHRGHRVMWHSGETIGFRNVMLRFPQEDLVVIVLTNQNERRPYDAAMAVADLFLPARVTH